MIMEASDAKRTDFFAPIHNIALAQRIQILLCFAFDVSFHENPISFNYRKQPRSKLPRNLEHSVQMKDVMIEKNY